jgi:hypothetical protein
VIMRRERVVAICEVRSVLSRHSLRDPAAGAYTSSRTVAEEARRRGNQVDVNPRRMPDR